MMWARLLSVFLYRFVRQGVLVAIYPDGQSEQYGEGTTSPVTVRFHSRPILRRLLVNPDLALGEAYMDGLLTIENGDLYGLIELVMSNQMRQPNIGHQPWLGRFRRMGRGLAQFNPMHRSHRNVAHHYDLSGKLYDMFLDTDRQYSCAYFQHPGDSLEAAQQHKKALIATKLLLAPGQRVLDIGSGWGGLGLYLAREYGVRVTGVTLSREQHKVSEERARAEKLDGQIRFWLKDYREVEGVFDRIVSVGMFEHVGLPHYREFFTTLRNRLADDGVALLHTIGRADGPGSTNPWIAKYIFPGGYSPALSEVLAVIERSGFYVTDVEVLRLHYAETLREWRQKFEANLDKIHGIYDERFIRMWRFYLIASELAFRVCGHVVFQIQLAKRQGAVPLTRDYLLAFEPSGELAKKKAA